jgi:hypothetical protein
MNIIIPVVPSCGVTEYLVIQVDKMGEVIKSVCVSRPAMVVSTVRGEHNEYLIAVKLNDELIVEVRHCVRDDWSSKYTMQDWTVPGDVAMSKLCGYDPLRSLVATVGHFICRLEKESHIYPANQQRTLKNIDRLLRHAIEPFTTGPKTNEMVHALLGEATNVLVRVSSTMLGMVENVSQCYYSNAQQTYEGIKVCTALAVCIDKECY